MPKVQQEDPPALAPVLPGKPPGCRRTVAGAHSAQQEHKEGPRQPPPASKPTPGARKSAPAKPPMAVGATAKGKAMLGRAAFARAQEAALGGISRVAKSRPRRTKGWPDWRRSWYPVMDSHWCSQSIRPHGALRRGGSIAARAHPLVSLGRAGPTRWRAAPAKGAPRPRLSRSCARLTVAPGQIAALAAPHEGLAAAGAAVPRPVADRPVVAEESGTGPGSGSCAPVGIRSRSRGRRQEDRSRGQSPRGREEAQGLPARAWPPRQDHPQEARRQGAAGFQDQGRPRGQDQGRRDRAIADEDGGQNPHHMQGNVHGAGKGNYRGRGNGRRGKGSKGKRCQAAQQTRSSSASTTPDGRYALPTDPPSRRTSSTGVWTTARSAAGPRNPGTEPGTPSVRWLRRTTEAGALASKWGVQFFPRHYRGPRRGLPRFCKLLPPGRCTCDPQEPAPNLTAATCARGMKRWCGLRSGRPGGEPRLRPHGPGPSCPARLGLGTDPSEPFERGPELF